ncbi:MAG: NUDIX domain-containing protein [Spirochaetes bacterium]|nr:NUDIX domain-containing protein [Spirochaetota bacterium]
MEIWDVYTKDRIKTGKIHIRGVPLSKGDYHLVVLVWIINDQGKILLTKRHPDKHWPNYWECTGGSVIRGEDSLTAALREVNEEIGIKINIKNGKCIHSYISDDTIYDVWIFEENIDLKSVKLQENEVIDIKYVNQTELIAMFAGNQIVPTLSFICDYFEN